MPVAFVLVKSHVGKEAEAHQALQMLHGVEELHCLFGDADFLCKVEAADYDAVARLVTRGIRAASGVAHTHTLTANTQLGKPAEKAAR